MNFTPRTKPAIQWVLAMMATFFVAASSAPQPGQNPSMPSVSNVWVKTTVPGSSVSAAYMQIKSATPLKLVKVESPISGLAEIHDMKMNDGVMEMKALDALDIPVDKTTELKPGGTHIMLMKVKQPIDKGDKVPLTLTFEGPDKKLMTLKLNALAQASDVRNNTH